MLRSSFEKGELRKKATQKLKVFLANPGRFSLLVLGSRGTGKRYAIETAFTEFNEEDREHLCLNKILFLNAGEIPDTASDLDDLFLNNMNNVLIIEDVEDLKEETQKLMFKSLSTTDGEFGINKKCRIRVVFTSSLNVDVLRDENRFLLGAFWDRISQLIIELPGYKEEPENINNDFKSTWDKMEFFKILKYKRLSALPKNVFLEKFLDDNAKNFDGGFRDLDKLCIMYFNYRILNYEQDHSIKEEIEKLIVYQIREDFFGKSQLHSAPLNDLSQFTILPGYSMDELNAQFRIQVRKWAHKEYKTLGKAAEKLHLSNGTLKNYVPGKASKQQRNSKINTK